MMATRKSNFAMQVKRASTSSVLASALLVLALFTCIFSSPPAHAAGAGRIFGQLLDGTKNTPLAGQHVTLQMAQSNLAIDLASATTDAQGSYAFPDLSPGKTTSYVLYIRYQGAQYTSNPIILNTTKPVQQVNLTVYEATASTANMAIVRATILLHKPNAQKGIIPVSELVIFRNLTNRTYVGSLDASHGKPNALRFSLPHTASNVTLGKGFDGYQAIQVNGGFAANAALPPGDTQFIFTFDMPYTSSSYDFDYTVLYPTVQLTVLVPTQIQASSDTLASQGTVTANSYSLLQASALLANKEVNVQLDGLPVLIPATNSPTTPSNPVPTWLLVILLLMAAILFGTWFLYRSMHRQTSKKKRSQAKQSGQRQSKKEPAKVENTVDSEQALLQELLDLDKAFEAGELPKAVYQERQARTRERLHVLLKEKVTS